MSLYMILSVSWLSFAIAVLGVLLTSRLRAVTRLDLLALGAISLLFLVLYVGLGNTSFHGLEYEDAFEYSYAAEAMAHDRYARQLQLNPVCIEGSVEECQVYDTLSHPTGL